MHWNDPVHAADRMPPCGMRWSEIDTSGAVWIYSPKHHKTSHKGKKRLVMIGPKGQQILNGLREMSRSDFVFDPMTGLEEFIRRNYGDDARVRQTVGQHYSPFSLHAAIRKACDKAGVPRWSPGQLRKTRATNARQQADLETAQQVPLTHKHGQNSRISSWKCGGSSSPSTRSQRFST